MGVGAAGIAPPHKFFSIFELKKASFGAVWVLFLQLNSMETGFVYKMWEILTMRRVSGRWSPKCRSLPRDAGDLVGLDAIINWLEARHQPNIGKFLFHFTVLFDGVHAVGYNSTKSISSTVCTLLRADPGIFWVQSA